MIDPSEEQQVLMTEGCSPYEPGSGLDAELPPAGGNLETTGHPSEPTSPNQDATDFGAEIAAVRILLEERLRYDSTKEQAFQRLYEDLDQFRGQAHFVQTRPLYLDLARLLDRLHQTAGQQREGYPNADGVFLASLEEEVEEMLARQGVVRLPASTGLFDPARHRAIQVELTQDPEAHNSIAHVVRHGYECNGRLLRAEEVVVRRFRAASEAGEQHD